MKKLLVAILIMMFVLSGCKEKPDEIKETVIEYVEDQYSFGTGSDYAYDVKEIKDHGQNGRGTVKCFLVDVNREDEIHHWLVYVDILKNGEIWQIDAGKWVEKK